MDQPSQPWKFFIYIYINIYIYIYKLYIPGTQMTLVLFGKGLLLKGSTTKIEDKQVPGIYIYTRKYTYIYIYVYIYTIAQMANQSQTGDIRDLHESSFSGVYHMLHTSSYFKGGIPHQVGWIQYCLETIHMNSFRKAGFVNPFWSVVFRPCATSCNPNGFRLSTRAGISTVNTRETNEEWKKGLWLLRLYRGLYYSLL